MARQLLIPATPARAEEDNRDAVEPTVASPPQACAACKHQRKKCGRSCLLAPYFPPERAHEFQYVHRVFGVSNVAKRLRPLGGADRAKAAAAMVWEAQCWIDGDPVQGAYGRFLLAQKEANDLHLRVQQCVLCSGRNVAPGGNLGMMNHPAYETNRRLPMADLQNYAQYTQVQGGPGTGQLQQQLQGVLPDQNVINIYGHHQHYSFHADQFQRG